LRIKTSLYWTRKIYREISDWGCIISNKGRTDIARFRVNELWNLARLAYISRESTWWFL